MTGDPGMEMRERRRQQLLDERPALGDLWELLLSGGGHEVVGAMETDEEIGRLVEGGLFISGKPGRLERGRTSACHENAARAWAKSPATRRLFTGYALTQNDGLWRQHSWNVDRKGRVIETTTPRELYYGYELIGPEAALFALANMG